MKIDRNSVGKYNESESGYRMQKGKAEWKCFSFQRGKGRIFNVMFVHSIENVT
jgi:hypothetical protein